MSAEGEIHALSGLRLLQQRLRRLDRAAAHTARSRASLVRQRCKVNLRGPGESSSRDTRVDLSPPKDDAKNHPNSGIDDKDPEDEPDGVQEMHPWNPYRAMKDDEVGDYYFKLKNYKAALARYQDALIWKEKDAVANFRMAQCYEKLDQPDQAIPHYEEYLKILPGGPYAKEARKALQKLKRAEAKNETSAKTESKP